MKWFSHVPPPPPVIDRVATSPLALEIWTRYARVFEHKWGLSKLASDYLGLVGADMGVAEFRVHGIQYYKHSLAVPLRNAWYMATVMDGRWEVLRHCTLKEPILDYGCGVGYTLVWLVEHGYAADQLYGWDVEGPQRQVTQEMFENEGINWWDEKSPTHFGTILCLNVFEHLPKPMDTLLWLRSSCDNLIANCDTSNDGDHTTSVNERQKVLQSLHNAGELWGQAT